MTAGNTHGLPTAGASMGQTEVLLTSTHKRLRPQLPPRLPAATTSAHTCPCRPEKDRKEPGWVLSVLAKADLPDSPHTQAPLPMCAVHGLGPGGPAGGDRRRPSLTCEQALRVPSGTLPSA